MGYILSETGLADDLYTAFHVWFGGLKGGLAAGTIGATIALPEMLKRGDDKVMITGVIQARSSLGILVLPSVVLVLYGNPLASWRIFPVLDPPRTTLR